MKNYNIMKNYKLKNFKNKEYVKIISSIIKSISGVNVIKENSASITIEAELKSINTLKNLLDEYCSISNI